MFSKSFKVLGGAEFKNRNHSCLFLMHFNSSYAIIPDIWHNLRSYPIIKKYCTVGKTREKATKYNEEGAGDANTKKLAKILDLRSQIVKILGFKTWSDLAVSDEMMNKPEEIKKFLEDLLVKLTPKFELTKTRLSKILQERNEKLSTSSFKFAEELLKIKDIVVREEEYKPYFELEKVLSVLFGIWENYFDIKTKYLSNIKIMHEESKVYEFTDGKSGELLGHGCMDLHPRSGKYGHACVADIYKKFIDQDGNKYAGFTFLICNFKKSLDGKTFVSLSDMNTLFHEAGHMLHMILMKNNYPSTSGTSRDFVEIPSQFHENFLANEKFVAENFKHFETGEKMSKLLIQNIKKMTNRGEEVSWVTVCIRALFDQSLHSKNILKFVVNSFK